MIEWTSYDVIKHHIITTDVTYQNSSKGKEDSALLRQGLSCAIKKKKKNFMAPFCGWGSTASRLEPL